MRIGALNGQEYPTYDPSSWGYGDFDPNGNGDTEKYTPNGDYPRDLNYNGEEDTEHLRALKGKRSLA